MSITTSTGFSMSKTLSDLQFGERPGAAGFGELAFVFPRIMQMARNSSRIAVSAARPGKCHGARFVRFKPRPDTNPAGGGTAEAVPFPIRGT